jgi:predicted nucleic acid-binding Zn ribbon protein
MGVERAAHEALIVEMWPEVAGPDAAAHAAPTGLRGTTLLVDVEPGLWLQELSARRGRFADEINRRLGTRVVTDIRIRPQAAPVPAAVAVPGEPPPSEVELSAEEQATVDRTVAEIADLELREAARKLMQDQLRWRKRHPASSSSDGSRPG